MTTLSDLHAGHARILLAYLPERPDDNEPPSVHIKFEEAISALRSLFLGLPDEEGQRRYEVSTPNLMTGECSWCGEQRAAHDDETLACPG